MKTLDDITLQIANLAPLQQNSTVDVYKISNVIQYPVRELDEDAEIIERSKNGDRTAFNELVLRHQRRVFNLCYRIIGNRDEAEDVAQEVFITVFKAIKNFRGDSTFSTWIHRVTTNHCKNRLKYLKRRRYFQTTSIDETQDTGEGEQKREYPSDEFYNPEEDLEHSEVGGEIENAIAQLDDDYRIVIVMRDVQGMSYLEIAEVLELKEGTVKSRIHRARLELQDKLRHLIENE